MNQDGSRRKMKPRLSTGGFHRRRLWFAWFLMVVFTITPYLRFRGKPLVLLNLPAREFTLFGTTFLPTDSLLLMLLPIRFSGDIITGRI